MRNHPTADLTQCLFQRHDRNRYRVFCYTYGKDDGSRQRDAIRAASDRFRDINDQDDRSAAASIHGDGVDILVELMGHTKGARLGICAFRPAPIQVRMLGMAGTSGASHFDYLIADRIVVPRADRAHYSENIVWMPHSYQVNNYDSDPLSEAEYAQANDPGRRFVFACFCTAYKIEQEVFYAWMRILKRVPDSLLWLMPESARVKKNFIHAAQAAGVDPRRLVFLEKLGKRAHLKRLARVDIALDTRTVNGAATTSDALWAGVPVLTIKGRHFASRMSGSLLAAVGLGEMVAPGIDAYEEKAVQLAQDAVALNRLKAELWKNRKTRPLFDTSGFLLALENAFETMWLGYANHAPAGMIDMTKA